MSTQRVRQFDEKMKEIEEFVYNPCSEKKLEFDISSDSLKKALKKEVDRVYLNTGVFFDY